MNLEQIFLIINDRKNQLPKKSYITSLFLQGKDRIIQKVGEETVEVIIAAKNNSTPRKIAEITDLWFHLLVYMAEENIRLADIYQELDKRRNDRLVTTSKNCYDQKGASALSFGSQREKI
jgi:phosphoribosyl-ATP pyrophosphohydrolase